MKRFLILFLFLLASHPVLAQPGTPNSDFKYGSVDPNGTVSCTPTAPRKVLYVRLSVGIYLCTATDTWTLQAGSGGSGLTNLNGLTTDPQTFATSTSGTNFTISSSGSTHTFNLPIASATNTGKLSNADWTAFNGKLSPSNNLSDVANASTARANLGAVPLTRQIIAGDGLAGGGDLSGTMTFDIDLMSFTTKTTNNANDYVFLYDQTASEYRKITRSNFISGLGGTPGGSNTQVQFNDGGAFAGDSDFTWNNTNKRLILGDGSAKGIQFGSLSGTFGGRFWRDSGTIFLGVPSLGSFQVIATDATSLFTVYEPNGRANLGAGSNGIGSTAQLFILANSATTVGAEIRQASSATADFAQFKSSAGTDLTRITASGDVYVTASTRGIILTDGSGGCWRVTVSTLGALTTTSVTCP